MFLRWLIDINCCFRIAVLDSQLIFLQWKQQVTGNVKREERTSHRRRCKGKTISLLNLNMLVMAPQNMAIKNLVSSFGNSNSTTGVGSAGFCISRVFFANLFLSLCLFQSFSVSFCLFLSFSGFCCLSCNFFLFNVMRSTRTQHERSVMLNAWLNIA